MKLTICTQRLMDAPVPIGAETICFVTTEGRKALEVKLLDDGGIEVRGCPDAKIDGEWYSERIEIRPRVSNSIEIRLIPREAAHG